VVFIYLCSAVSTPEKGCCVRNAISHTSNGGRDLGMSRIGKSRNDSFEVTFWEKNNLRIKFGEMNYFSNGMAVLVEALENECVRFHVSRFGNEYITDLKKDVMVLWGAGNEFLDRYLEATPSGESRQSR
jgi:hypothetical protein